MAPRAEDELLLCCARTHLDGDEVARIEALLRQDVHWDHLLRMALRHGMLPLLYWHLTTAFSHAVPKAVLDGLRPRFRQNAVRNLALTRELVRILDLFKGHGIAAIPIKGPLLAWVAYGNLAFRTFQDLDVLVHERDVLRAKDLLVAEGYRPSLQLTHAQELAHLKSNHDYGLRHDSGVLVELHWAFAEPHFSLAFDPERVWERAELTSLADAEVLSLSSEDLLLSLCLHHSKETWVRLEWICAIAEMVRRRPIQWGLMVRRAELLGMARMLLLGLSLASSALGAPVPEDVRRKAQADPSVDALTRQVRRRLFLVDDDRPRTFQWSAAELVFHVRVRERWRDKLRYAARLSLDPSVGDRTFLRLPSHLSFLYPVLRPARLLVKWMVGKDGLR